MPAEKRIFVITEGDGTITRIRAASMHQHNRQLLFYDKPMTDWTKYIAIVEPEPPFSVIPQDMLLEPLSESLIDPFVVDDNASDHLDFLSDALFSEDEKRPFAVDERRLLVDALERAKAEIAETFETNAQQQRDIDVKIDYLSRKVAELDRFSWKRLFVSVLVGISVDLMFGTVIPVALVELFSGIVEQFARGRKLIRSQRKRNPDTGN